MGRYALVSMLVLLVAAGTGAHAAESMSADEQAIAKIEQAWAKASAAKDRAFLKRTSRTTSRLSLRTANFRAVARRSWTGSL